MQANRFRSAETTCWDAHENAPPRYPELQSRQPDYAWAAIFAADAQPGRTARRERSPPEPGAADRASALLRALGLILVWELDQHLAAGSRWPFAQYLLPLK